jgi:TonB family protein
MIRLIVGAWCVALSWAPLEAQSPGIPPVRVRWTMANTLVYADSSPDVHVWLATNVHAVQGGQPAQEEVSDGFFPDSVDAWSVFTRQLLALRAPPIPGDTAAVVSSGILRGKGGTLLIAGRAREQDHLRDGVRLLVVPKGKLALVFDLRAEELDTLVSALEAAALRAHTNVRAAPATMADSESTTETQVSVDPDFHHSPRYPAEMKQRNIEGEVWADFVVDSTGRIELPTVQVFLSDDAAFERAVRNYLGLARFRPATVGGRPVRQRVRQRFTFALTR